MRRSLILTVAAAVTMVLLAMLVPMAVLLRSYALEDRLAQAALEVQATETVVSAGDVGDVNLYLSRINDDDGIATTVVYPDGTVIGPAPRDAEQSRIAEARATGTARVDDVAGGTVVLVPVSLGLSTAAPDQTPVVRVFVEAPGLESDLVRSWAILLVLGLALLGGALVLADRLSRSFVTPIGRLAAYATRLGERRQVPPPPVDGPPEVKELGRAIHLLVGRIEVLLERERAGIADISHRLRTPITTLRLRVDGLADPAERERVGADLDELQAMVDHVVRQARRSEREGLVAAADAVAVILGRVRFWEPLAEDQGRVFDVVDRVGAPVVVSVAEEDLVALVDVLLDNVFSHTPEPAAVRVVLSPAGSGVRLTVEDGGPGLASVDVLERGSSGAGSTGLGLAIARETATVSGGGLEVGRSELGGARVDVLLGVRP